MQSKELLTSQKQIGEERYRATYASNTGKKCRPPSGRERWRFPYWFQRSLHISYNIKRLHIQPCWSYRGCKCVCVCVFVPPNNHVKQSHYTSSQYNSSGWSDSVIESLPCNSVHTGGSCQSMDRTDQWTPKPRKLGRFHTSVLQTHFCIRKINDL